MTDLSDGWKVRYRCYKFEDGEIWHYWVYGPKTGISGHGCGAPNHAEVERHALGMAGRLAKKFKLASPKCLMVMTDQA